MTQTPPPDAVELTQSIAGGTDFAWDADFWVSPLPPEGPVTFVAGWPDAGVPGDRRAEFDGAALRAAAARCVQVWPEESYLPTGRVTWGTAHAADAELPASGPQEDGGPAAP